MPSYRPALYALSLLTFSPFLQAEPTPPTPEEQTAATSLPTPDIRVISGSYELKKGTEIRISFGAPMINDDEVNQPVKEGFVHCNYADRCTMTWVSPSGIRLVLNESLPPLEIFRLEVPSGLKSRYGKELAGSQLILPTHYDSIVSIDRSSNGNFFIRANEDELTDTLRSLLPELSMHSNGENRPLSCRPATVADAIADWSSFDAVHDYNLRDEDHESLSTRPADEVLPDVWVIENPGISSTGSDIYITLPRQLWNRLTKNYEEGIIATISPEEKGLHLSNTCSARGVYRINLRLNVPAVSTDPAALISSLRWIMREDAHSNEWKELKWENGALRGKIRGKDITITPTSADVRSFSLVEGGEVQALCAITLHAETGGREISLKAMGDYEALGKNDEAELKDYTYLRPRTPFIYTDICASHMQLRGSTTVRCRYGQLENGTLNVWKLKPQTPTEAVRLLHSYFLNYTGHDFGNWDAKSRQLSSREAAGLKDDKLEDNRLDPVILPGIATKAQRSLSQGGENELSLPLSELFEGQPVGGFYFIDVEGTPLRNSKTPLVNQGIIQVTDLGLIWKTNGKQLLAWAYSLSSAKEIPSGTLLLMDEQGNQLAELPVVNGVAEGNFPPATRYLHLRTENDCVTMAHANEDLNYEASDSYFWETRQLLKNGLTSADLPTPLIYLFRDRNLYRPGEVAHIKGLARWLSNNELSTADIVGITARLYRNYDEQVATIPVTIEENGSFTADVTLPINGDYRVAFQVEFRGDKDKTSPDLALKETHSDLDYIIDSSREFDIYLSCTDFRRNEFEVSSSMNIQTEQRQVRVEATATNFTTTPVAHGVVNWSLTTSDVNFYPEQTQWADFRFGDFRENCWDFFYARYCGRTPSYNDEYISQNGTLDAEGHGSALFTLPEQDFPRKRTITATTTVTNGNEQSINSVQRSTIHPADVYAGMRPHSSLAKAHGSLPVDLVAICPDGTPWQGAPLQATITVSSTVFHAYRYGSGQSSSVRNSEEETLQQSIPVTLTGTPSSINIPLGKAGRYDITISGKDPHGREFRSATRHYVWGDEDSPWEYLDYNSVALEPDKPLYTPGQTAKVLVQTPVDAELLVTVERDRVLRHYRCNITVDNPIIEIPIEEGDAPVVYLGVSLVQNDAKRSSDGKPQHLVGTCKLMVANTAKKLTIDLQAPEHSLLPGAPCTVSGVITDSDGRPVPHADVTLYAEDEGTLQVTGYSLPDPLSYFYSEIGRAHSVGTFSTLGSLVSEQLRKRDYGNKGVFIGGGDDCEEEQELSDEQSEQLRDNFTPCALWLSTIRTDDQGRFSTTYTNPDTLTRYRLMAIAAAGDKFGAGQTDYLVNKPIMLEPIAPMSATEGDQLLLPVTVSMLPDLIDGVNDGDSLTWQVTLSGSNVDLPQTSRTVTLTGNQPTTIHFPVTVKSDGPVELNWSVQAAQAPVGSNLSRMKDAVRLSFPVVPPTPHLREYISTELPNGTATTLSQWLRTAYRKGSSVHLTFSTSPLAGLGYPMKYLFTYPYGCTEQLSSTIAPWLMRDKLHEALGIDFPTERDPATLIAEVDCKLRARRLSPGCYGYWDHATQPCAYSPYAVLIRSLINADNPDCASDHQALNQQIIENKGNTYLSALVLARLGKLSPIALENLFNRADETGKKNTLSEQQLWVLAIVSTLTGHESAAERSDRAAKSAPSGSDYDLPPTEALKAMHAIATAPQAPATTARLRNWLTDCKGYYSTWRNGWMVLAIGDYVNRTNLSSRRARVNGHDITSNKPLHLALRTGDPTPYTAIGNPVFVTGYAEGYLTSVQPEQSINKGFRIDRRYEQLQPDGTWKPTATFRVGDVVRVTVNAYVTNQQTDQRYIVIEDRLPAAFEAVNPELKSQTLPEGIQTQETNGWWNFGAYISNREFHKDKVQAFIDQLPFSRSMEFSYVARVVRSGTVTAPAAKVELMYRPEVYGLSIPQHFTVSER